jgi:cell fate regulator YaaT (PSP1 superfamily)
LLTEVNKPAEAHGSTPVMTFIDLPVVQQPPVLKPPSSLVVRYGYLRMIGEFPYDGETRPGCGAKVVIETRRGTEMAEVLTTTCSNGGCAKSITRDKLFEYIDNSGGRDYPFSTDGRVLRIATPQDYAEQSRVEAEKPDYVATCKTLIREMDLPMKLVEVELLLGGEMATFFFMSEHRVDFRSLVKHLASRFRTRIQMHQVGARDEARLVADYETCGQHCCCRQFLKVLKPISMGAAKMQKATLDPNKISGRCGRLKCCLRYEEESYDELRRKLPRVNSRVRTAEGVGVVIETMILTQLVKVRLDNDRIVAVANEELLERDLPATLVDRAPMSPREERRREGENREQRPPREPGPVRPGRDGRDPREGRQPRDDSASREARPPRPARPQPPSIQQPLPQSAQEPERVDDSAARASAPPERPAVPSQGDQPPVPPVEPVNDAGEADEAEGGEDRSEQAPGVGMLGRRRRRRRGRGRPGRGDGPSNPNPNPPPQP